MTRTFAAALMALALPAAMAAAQTTPKVKLGPAPMTNASDGAEMYQSYCAACHGKTGKGDGPAAPALRDKPADLTQLARTHGGTFSAKDFEDKINGQGMTPAHGSSAMPVWGPVFRTIGNDTLRVYNLRKYVESLDQTATSAR